MRKVVKCIEEGLDKNKPYIGMKRYELRKLIKENENNKFLMTVIDNLKDYL